MYAYFLYLHTYSCVDMQNIPLFASKVCGSSCASSIGPCDAAPTESNIKQPICLTFRNIMKYVTYVCDQLWKTYVLSTHKLVRMCAIDT